MKPGYHDRSPLLITSWFFKKRTSSKLLMFLFSFSFQSYTHSNNEHPTCNRNCKLFNKHIINSFSVASSTELMEFIGPNMGSNEEPCVSNEVNQPFFDSPLLRHTCFIGMTPFCVDHKNIDQFSQLAHETHIWIRTPIVAKFFYVLLLIKWANQNRNNTTRWLLGYRLLD